METNHTRVCELLVGLLDMEVLGVDDDEVSGSPLRVHVASRLDQGWCRVCGVKAKVKDRADVCLVDLPCFGRPTRLVWRKHRWVCTESSCPEGTWTVEDPRVAPSRAGMTDRAARWVTRQVGKEGRAVAEVARELGCDWHTVNNAVVAYGEALLEADTERVGEVRALGLDETLFFKKGQFHEQQWSTSVVDVGGNGHTAKLVEMVEGRTAKTVLGWLDAQPDLWLGAIRYGTLDLSGPYRKVFNAYPHIMQVADPFHLVKLANERLDDCRRRVQNETLGHRGRKDDPLYRCRRLLTMGHERLDEKGDAKLLGLLEAGDPRGEVRMCWHAKEVIRSIYDIDDPVLAREFVTRLAADLQDPEIPAEMRSFGRTLARWIDQVVAWHRARVTNGPTEAINNLIKRVKRVAFGLRTFRHYRVRALLYAGKPNWSLLAGLEVRALNRPTREPSGPPDN